VLENKHVHCRMEQQPETPERYLLYLLFLISCCVLLSLSFITNLNSSLPEEHNLVYPACCVSYFHPFVSDLLSMYTLVLVAFETLTKH